MKILVYGAGIIGCELAHELYNGNNDVTLLVRNKWKETIDNNGLVIRHYGQLRTTRDKINTIDTLKKDDYYDLIFVAMQYHQMLDVIPILAENISTNIVFVGNNANPALCEEKLKSISRNIKNIAFGFQGTGGRKEFNRIVSMHFKVELTIGGLKSSIEGQFKSDITKAFNDTKCKIIYENNMEGWLLSHAAHVLPTAYLCYILDGNLKRATIKQIEMAVEAVNEAHNMLKQLGYPICPDGEEEEYSIKRKSKMLKLFFMMKSPAGKFVISTHCMNAVKEMMTLDKTFKEVITKSNVTMPAWEQLEREAVNKCSSM